MKNILNVDIDGLLIGPGNPVRVMSVINLSSESFYKKSVADTPEMFHKMIDIAVKEEADIIDIGAASSAPKEVYGTPDISIEREVDRVTQALTSIDVSRYPPISIDTTSSRVAEVALDLGASMVNDITGLHADADMASLVADRGVPIVLMANCGTPCGSIQASLNSLKESLAITREIGIKPEKILIDPGIGFGKPPEVDIAILKELNQFVELNHPLLVGVSRKAFIGHVLGQPNPDDRLIGSIIVAAFVVTMGASVIRTHDVRETKVAVQIGESLRGT